MTREQLIQRTAGTQRLQLRGHNLRGFDFSGLDLTGADLSFSNLIEANFDGATLRGADLSYSGLRDSTFREADLSGANLNFSDMTRTVLTGANLTGTKLNLAAAPAKMDSPPSSEPPSLATLLQKPGWGVVIGMVLGALIVYGFSGIIYFTAQIVTASDPLYAQLYRFLIAQNVTIGATIFLIIWLLDDWLNQTFRRLWVRHALATVATFLTTTFTSLTTYFIIGRPAIEQLAKRPDYSSANAPGWVYVTAYLLVGNVFLYVLRQGRQVTRKLTEQEYQLLNMEKLKNRAELDALQARINPHFLYNSLNSIASLVHEDPDKAETMTLLLSKLFRYSTGRDGSHFCSLEQELDMVKTYLEVEAVRFGDRLTFTISPISQATSQVQIPQFLLQPIVENAIKHGIAKRADDGLITVQIDHADDWLTIQVHDNGPAFPDTMGAGYGLRSIQDKLRLLYGETATVTLQNSPQKQVVLKLKTA